MKLTPGSQGNPARALFPQQHAEGRQRRRSRSSSISKSVTPKKRERSNRRLFEDTEDLEVTLKSPFKIPPVASTASRTLFSPVKPDNITPKKKPLPGKSPKKLPSPSNTPKKSPRRALLLSPVKPASDCNTPKKKATAKSPSKKALLLFSPVQTTSDMTTTPKKNLKNSPRKTASSPLKPMSPRKTRRFSEAETEKADDLEEAENATPSRPSRRKKFVERMGIDDVKLSEVVSPRVKLTPFSKIKLNVQESKEIEDLGDLDGVQELAEAIEQVQNDPVLRKKLSLTCIGEAPLIEDLPKKRKRVQEDDFDYNVKAVESPNGEIKLKINRTLKPINATVQRISRRASLQIGISPENLLKLQTRSPSPVKKFNKENVQEKSKYSPLSSTSLFTLTTSPILNIDVHKERRPSKNSPARKRRRVSKKLYD